MTAVQSVPHKKHSTVKHKILHCQSQDMQGGDNSCSATPLAALALNQLTNTSPTTTATTTINLLALFQANLDLPQRLLVSTSPNITTTNNVTSDAWTRLRHQLRDSDTLSRLLARLMPRTATILGNASHMHLPMLQWLLQRLYQQRRPEQQDLHDRGNP